MKEKTCLRQKPERRPPARKGCAPKSAHEVAHFSVHAKKAAHPSIATTALEETTVTNCARPKSRVPSTSQPSGPQ